MTYRVIRTGRTWAVEHVQTGQIAEGGFFSRAAAQDCRDKWESAAGTAEQG